MQSSSVSHANDWLSTVQLKSLSTEDDSPYPEVRSAVANTDDRTIPVSTVRAWVIGIIWAMIIPGMNQFFFFRFPAVTVGGVSILSPLQNIILILARPDRRSADFLPRRSCMG